MQTYSGQVVFYQIDIKSVKFLENINLILINILVFLTHLFWNLRIYISAWWKIQSFNMHKKKKREVHEKKLKFYIWKHDYIMYKQKSLLINQCLFPSNPTIPIFWHVYTTNCSQNTWFSLKRSPVYQFWRRMIHKKHGYS